MMSPMSDDYPDVLIHSRAEWRQWLADNHDRCTGIWLVRFKKDSGHPHVPYDDVVEEALCFGWVDSRPRAVDEERSALLVTPRAPTSNWSAANKARVARLVDDGLMHPSGAELVAAARENGAWNALDDVERLIEPDDLRAALDAEPAARANWDAFPPSARRGILEWILTAKREPTRARRIARTVSEAAAGQRANQWPPPGR